MDRDSGRGVETDGSAGALGWAGMRLSHRPESPVPRSEERRVVTVLFCDMVSFTPRSEHADPEDVRARVDIYFERLQRAVEGYGGVVAQYLGDGIMAVFGAPIAHEDDPERAVRAGLRILDEIVDLNVVDPDLDIAVRIGINTGEVLARVSPADWAKGLVTGDVVNTAARLQTVAPEGGAIVSETTYAATKNVFVFEALPPATVKGKSEPLAIWRVKSPLGRFGRDLVRVHTSTMVDRRQEMQFLQASFERSLRDSSLHTVTITGDAGVGKSRLVTELSSYADDRPGIVRWRQGRCLPYGEGISFWALGEIIKAEAGIYETDDPVTAGHKIDALIPDGTTHSEWLKARLRPLIGLETTEASQDENFAAWRRFLESLAEQRPTVLVIEDLHWADDALLAFLEDLASHADGVPLLVVLTARPELYERVPTWLASARNATRIDLEPLSETETAELISNLLEHAVLPQPAQQAIVSRAGGNPLYAEEFVRFLKDTRTLAKRNSTWTLDPNADIPVPSTIANLIAARLDTLALDRKQMLADASVIGPVFWSSAVAAVGGFDQAEVETALRELSRADLVRPIRHSSMAGESEYVFRHSLVRDVAYARIPRIVRAEEHQAAAAWLERVAAGRLEDVSEIIAEHHTAAIELFRAARLAERADALTDPAIHYLTLAGDRAMALDAAGAESLFRRAMVLARADHHDRPRIVAKLADAVHVSGNLGEASTLYEEAIASFSSRGEALAAADLVARYAVVLIAMAQFNRARELLNNAIAELEPKGASAELAQAYAVRAYPGWNDQPDQAIADAEMALDLAEKLDLPGVRARALDFRGGARIEKGDPSGIDDHVAALELTRRLGATRQTYVTWFNLVGDLCLEDPAEALKVADDGLQFVGGRGLAEGEAWLRTYRLQALLQLGRWEELEQSADEVISWATAKGVEWIVLMATFPLAIVLSTTGRVDEGVRRIEEVSSAAERQRMTRLFRLADVAALQQKGLDERAADRLELAVAEFRTDTNGLAESAGELMRLAARLGRLDLVREVEQLLLGDLAILRRTRESSAALIAEGEARYEDASELFELAASAWATFGNPYERGHALLGRARSLAAIDRNPDASASARIALGLFDQVGAKPAAAKAAALISK